MRLQSRMGVGRLWRPMLIAGAIVLGTMALAACGGDDEESTAGGAATPGAANMLWWRPMTSSSM